MTFTATGEPANDPPRVLLEVDPDSTDATWSTLVITRDGEQIRNQPPTGGETASTYDYEMPFGTVVEYVAQGTFLPFLAPDWTETWASLASWTGDTADWSVAGGEASSTVNLAAIERTASGSIQRLEVTDPANVVVIVATADELHSVGVRSDATGTTLAGLDTSVTTETGSYTLTVTEGTATVTGTTGWSIEVPASSGPFTKVMLFSDGGEYQETGTPWSSVGRADRIVVGASGNHYTLDINAKLVRKFNSAGVFQTSWSTTGTPNDLATDSSDNVYVTDQTSNLVRKFTSTGTASTTWSTTGTPIGVGVDSSDNVYVYDYLADVIRKYTSTGTVVTSWANGDTAEFTGGKALDVLPGGSTVYTVVSTDDSASDETTINWFSSTGTPLGSAWFGDESPNASIRVNSSGDYWVDTSLYDGTATGGPQVPIGSVSISPHIPRGLATSGSTILLADGTDNTVRSFASNTASVGTIATTLSVPVESFYETASLTLDITEAWLIHPGQPTLSVSIDAGTWRDEGINVDPASAQQTTAKSAVTFHQPVGRTRAVAITTGNRLEDEWELVLLTPRLADRDAVRAIVTDQTPLLLRSPTAFNWDLADGFYTVGDLPVNRLTPNLTNGYRRITLPLTPSDSPVVRTASERTYASLLEDAVDYAGLLLEYDTYTDLLLGTA